VIEIGVGIAVLALCFVKKTARETEISIEEKLGNGFTRAPFAAIIVSFFFLDYKMCKINPGIF
jgi:palmitoyltransferase ZDHHC1/11